MGTRMTTLYANLFMGKFEQHAIENAPLTGKPFVWWRFIDDVFMIWTEGEEHLKDFISYLISIHANIKFCHKYSNSSHQTLPFLDVQVHLSNNHIQTDLHTKPIDKHQYLLKTSCHPNHTKQTSLSCKTVANVLPTLSLTNEAQNSSSTWPNRVQAILRHITLKPQEQTTLCPSILLFPKCKKCHSQYIWGGQSANSVNVSGNTADLS